MPTLYWTNVSTDQAWENPVNWFLDSAASIPALNVPWLDGTDITYLAYDLTLADGEISSPTMDINEAGLNFGTGVTGSCYIAGLGNSGTINGGTFTGDSLGNYGAINGGTYSPLGTAALTQSSGTTFSVSLSVSRDPGFTNGGGTYSPVITTVIDNLISSNVADGVTILGIDGTVMPAGIKLGDWEW